jgi:hypothetical protein
MLQYELMRTTVRPPANMAMFPTDVAAKLERPTLSSAVDHLPELVLYMSTAFESISPDEESRYDYKIHEKLE